MLDASKKTETKDEVKTAEVVVDPKKDTLYSALMSAAGLSAFIGVGALCPDPAFLGMVTTFSLAVIAGY